MRRRRHCNQVTKLIADCRSCLRRCFHERSWRRSFDDDLGWVFVACDIRIGLTVDVWIVAVGNFDAADKIRLVGDQRAVRQACVQHDIELNQDLAVNRQAEVANIEYPGVIRAAIRICVGRVGGAWNRIRNERQRSRNEHR